MNEWQEQELREVRIRISFFPISRKGREGKRERREAGEPGKCEYKFLRQGGGGGDYKDISL